MKHFIILTLACLISVQASSQNITNKQFALINYELNISDEFRDDLKPVKKFLKEAEVYNEDADDKLKALMVHHIYYHLTEQLEEKVKLDILPINSFMDEVKYDDFGYPQANINKVLRVGDSPFYFKLIIDIDSQTEEKKKENPKIKGDLTFPVIKVDITVYNDDGIIPVDKWHGEKIAYKPFEVNEHFFSTFVKEEQISGVKTDQESLFELYKEAVANLIEKI